METARVKVAGCVRTLFRRCPAVFLAATLLFAGAVFAPGPVRAGIIGGFELPAKKAKPKPPTSLPGTASASVIRPGATFTEPVTGMEFVWVPGGCFQMGSNNGGGDEKPIHKVCIDGFWIGKYEVTQKQWGKIMNKNPSRFPEGWFKIGGKYPVENVSWDDCQEFIRKLNAETSSEFRLPTEAEWEYACRSGGQVEKYSGGDDVDLVAWYDDNSGHSTHPVGRKLANGLGLYDMSGNVWEWCADWYYEGYYANSPERNPQGPGYGSSRVMRGGGLNSWHESVRSCFRSGNSPSFRSYYLGFRLVTLEH
jgi:formylglycine-generating enzyme required for sulfatase activity